MKLRRSALYMPANNARALEKAKSLMADCIILDLEDAVAVEQKAQAREAAVGAIAAGGFGWRELAIRVNACGTEWFEADVQAVASSGAQVIVLPKVEAPQTVCDVAARIPEAMEIWAMIETPRGVANVEAIAQAHSRLSCLVMGTSDLAKELRVPHRADRLGFLYSLSRCVLAARLAGIDVLDGVHLDFANQEAFRAVCEQGRDLGFDGKSLIHPSQIAVSNEVFAPSLTDIDRARSIVALWQQAQARGAGVAVLDGKLIENLHVVEAQRTLAFAEMLAARQ